MRIHTDTLRITDLRVAELKAGVELRWKRHGSRSRSHAYEIKLRGNSKRRPNFYDDDGSFAATWDQWGVFLGYLFALDPDMVAGPYSDEYRFHYMTQGRFDLDWDAAIPFPLDHDHRFRFAGVPYYQTCTKCGATYTWAP